jgi:hypothetical protein
MDGTISAAAIAAYNQIESDFNVPAPVFNTTSTNCTWWAITEASKDPSIVFPPPTKSTTEGRADPSQFFYAPVDLKGYLPTQKVPGSVIFYNN